MANERPQRTVHDAIEAHEEKAHLSGNVEDDYRRVLNRVPDEVHEFLGPSNGAFDCTRDSYVNISKRNYEARVEPGARVMVVFSNVTDPTVKAIGTVQSDTADKQEDVAVEIGSRTITIPGYRIKGVFE